MDDDGGHHIRVLHGGLKGRCHLSLVLKLLIAMDLEQAVRVKLLQQLLVEKGLRLQVWWDLLGIRDEVLG